MSRQYFRLCCFWRIFRLRKVEPPEDIKLVFKNYSENGVMSTDNLHKFLTEYQGELTATIDYANTVYDSVKHLSIFHRNGLHLHAFFWFLFGDLNRPLDSSIGVHHEMNAPLAHYFIYTSHNTYLSGIQHFSKSSTEPIEKALKAGVRVIELDLWPNSAQDDVEIRHVWTTAPVSLDDCLQCIKTHAFCASAYPVIITLEDHLIPQLQAKVAHMVTQTFGSMLFIPESDLDVLPSPEFLKGKILISTKVPKEHLTSQDKEEVIQVEISEERVKTSKQDKSAEGNDYKDKDVQTLDYRCIIAINGVKLKGGAENLLTPDIKKAVRLSLSEQELEVAVKEHGKDIVRFTQQNLLRVYPKGTRISSSNYNPFVGWMHGAQLVAFNMQGYGKHLWAMQGMFRANGGCGYVKKPDYLLSPGLHDKVIDPSVTLPIKKTLKVKVYMGEGWHTEFHHTHFDRYSPPDFFVRVWIDGVPADSKLKKTRTIEDDWVPLWNEEFEFQLRVPELALFCVEVHEFDTTKKHDFGGQTCLPISELRTGIRSVQLHNYKGEKYKFVKLLMSFKFD